MIPQILPSHCIIIRGWLFVCQMVCQPTVYHSQPNLGHWIWLDSAWFI
jgi:hypothetical protein